MSQITTPHVPTQEHVPSQGQARVRPSAARQVISALLFVLIVAAVAFGGSLATAPHTEGWYADAERAPWSPPDWLFGPAWTLLYAFIALAGFLIWRSGFRGPELRNAARGTLALFVAQLVLNSLWTPLFFAGFPVLGAVAWWLAMVDIVALIVLVVWLIGAARKWSKVAAGLLVPYVAWLVFASTLNMAIIVLN